MTKLQLSLTATIQPRPANSPVPLLPIQRLWWDLYSKQENKFSKRMCAAAVRIRGPLDIEVLQRSVAAVVQRHESLRTRIVVVGSTPRQQIDLPHTRHFEVVDLANFSTNCRDAETRRLVEEFLDEPIDLSVGPLFEAKLWRISDSEHVLILAIDHVVSDGTSNAILYKDIWSQYDQENQRLSIFTPPIPVQLGDYAVWLEETYDAWLSEHEGYWRTRLRGSPSTHVPRDEGKEATAPSAARSLSFGRVLSATLRDVATREGVQLPVIALTIYIAVMARWCRQNDLLIGFISHGRYGRPELANVVGFLTNFLYLRIQLTQGDSFRDLLTRSHLELRAAYEHQDYNRVPHFISGLSTELDFVWLSKKQRPATMDGLRGIHNPLTIEPFMLPTVRVPVFTPYFYDTPAGLGATVHYRPDLIALTAVEQFGHRARRVAEALAEHPLTPVMSTSIDA